MHRKTFQFLSLFVITFLLVSTALAGKSGDNVWQETNDSALLRQGIAERTIIPKSYKTFGLNKAELLSILRQAPMEFTSAAQNNEIILTLPMPNGSFARFKIEKSPVVEAGLSAKYPELGETYRGQGIDDPTATVRFDFLPTGFHSMILSAFGTVLVDPYFKKGDTENYISYLKMDAPRTENFVCDFHEEKTLDEILSPENLLSDKFLPDASANVISGTQLRTYRLALAATNEYSVAVGSNTVAGTLAAQVLIMNRVNGVYERDLAIHMNIIANNNLIVYAADNTCAGVACTSANDPYTNNNGSTMLTENTNNLNTVIGTANFDIGHVFSTGGGGVATLNGPCGTNKSRGVTGLTNPIGDAFAIDYVAHEMGHQWGANHTFNGNTSNCAGGNRSAGSAYETGSGITIMAYAGICTTQDLDRHSIDTFHVKSLEVIVAYSQTGNGNTCAVTTSTGNTPPTVSSVGGTSFNIPKQTPFALTASGTDVNGDSLTYDWQEYDLGAATTAVPNTDAGGAMPIFRPYVQTVSGTRTFPALQYILNNANVPPATFDCGRTTPCLTGELLPAITRTMTFQAVARDNNANGGGINTATATVAVDGNSGPFAITAPNTATTFSGGSTQTVTWNVTNTTAAPVNAANVKISLSTDGGQTFPTVLLASTANDGTENVTIPSTATTQGRIKVEAVGNIFFDVSDANFTITTSTTTPRTKFDFDGDGKSDISVYRNGIWYIQRSTAGFFATQFGLSNDKTVSADYDGDNKTDLAVFRDGTWYIANSGNGSVSIVNWGLAGDIPMQGDYDGDNKADLAIYRNGVWYILSSINGSVRIENFGLSTDKPVIGDFDGDAKQDLAVYRNGIWYVQGSQQGFFAYQFGLSGDIPQPADYDGDGKTDFAVYRNGVWYVQRTTQGFGALQFGNSTDIPATADYDGDGKSDFVVYRPSEGNWYLYQSTAGVAIYNFGLNGDKPIPAQSN
jgi:Metallo-peptidase family M12